VRLVFFREYIVEQCRPQIEDVGKKFPSFVSAEDLFCRITGRAIEGTRKIWHSTGNGLAMLGLHITFQDHPVPRLFVVKGITINCSAKET
jgi:hypothetical protein